MNDRKPSEAGSPEPSKAAPEIEWRRQESCEDEEDSSEEQAARGEPEKGEGYGERR